MQWDSEPQLGGPLTSPPSQGPSPLLPSPRRGLGSRPAVNAWGSLLSRKIEGDSQWGDAWGQGPLHVPLWGSKWEVGLVSLGSPSSQLGEQNGSGKGFQEMDDSPSLVWGDECLKTPPTSPLYLQVKTPGTERGIPKVTEPAHWPQSSV